MWHAFTTPEPVVQAFADAYQRVDPGTPFHFSATPQQSLGGREATCDRGGRWTPPVQNLHRTRAVERAVASLNADQIAEAVKEAGGAIDAMSGSFTAHYRSLAVAAVHA